MNIELLGEFVCLHARKRELDSELKASAGRIDDLEEAIVPPFLSDAIAYINVRGRTVYLAKDIQASPANDRADAIRALRQCRLDQYVSETCNPQSFRGFVREAADPAMLLCHEQNPLFSQEDIRAALPAPLREALKISFVNCLCSRKA
jgi:hypothetical protein